MECKRAEPKDATSASAFGQAYVDQASAAAGAMILAQGPDGSISLVPMHALGAGASGQGSMLVYPQGAAGNGGVGLASQVDIAAYRAAAAAGMQNELLQAGVMQQQGNTLSLFPKYLYDISNNSSIRNEVVFVVGLCSKLVQSVPCSLCLIQGSNYSPYAIFITSQIHKCVF